MAQRNGISDKKLKNLRKQHTLTNTDELTRNALSSTSDDDETDCDCISSSDSQVFRQKAFRNNLSKRSRVAQRNRKKDDEFVDSTKLRKKFRSHKSANTKYDNSVKNSVYPSRCEVPRTVKKSVLSTNIIEHPNETRVKSTEVIKTFPQRCCAALRQKKPFSQRKKRVKNGEKLLKNDKKNLSDEYLMSSLSSQSSPRVNKRHNVESNVVTLKSNVGDSASQRKKYTKDMSSEFSNSSNVSSLESNLKCLNNETYRTSERANMTQERYEKKSNLHTLHSEKNRKTLRKVKNDQTEIFPRDLSHENQDYPAIKIHDNEKKPTDFIDDKSINDHDLSVFCKCEESDCEAKAQNDSSRKYWPKWSQQMETIGEEYRRLSSELKGMRRVFECGKKPKSREAKKTYMSQRYPDSFSFDVRLTPNELDSPRSNKEPSNKLINETPIVHRCPNDVLKAIDQEKSKHLKQTQSEKLIDEVTNLTNLTANLKINSQEENIPTPENSLNCQMQFCKCNVVNDPEEEQVDGIEESPKIPTHQAFSHAEKSSESNVKQHGFSMPKIEIPHSNERSDIRKIFIYGSEDDQSPLTVYRTSSYFTCKVKKNKHIGYRYVLTYVQKYVSPTWTPSRQNKESDVQSPDVVKCDNE